VAGKKYERQKKTAADSASKFGQKGQKSGRKKILETNGSFVREKDVRRCQLLLNKICHLIPLFANEP
jgi:hypothetical protein